MYNEGNNKTTKVEQLQRTHFQNHEAVDLVPDTTPFAVSFMPVNEEEAADATEDEIDDWLASSSAIRSSSPLISVSCFVRVSSISSFHQTAWMVKYVRNAIAATRPTGITRSEPVICGF